MSSHAAPATGQFQSHSRTRPSVLNSRLSSRTSVCTSVEPDVTSANPAASAAASAAWVANPGTKRTAKRSPEGGPGRELGGKVVDDQLPPGTGVRMPAICSTVARQRSRSAEDHGRTGARLRRARSRGPPTRRRPRPEEAWRRGVGRECRELAGLLAIGVGEDPLRLL